MESNELTTRTGRIVALQVEDGDAVIQSYRINLIPLNQATDDGRIFEKLEWRDPPLPLMATKKTSMGHDGATFVGNITGFSIEKIDDVEWVTADVVWDQPHDESERAVVQDFKRLVDEGRMTTVSADVALIDWDIDITFDQDGFVDDMKLVVHLGKVVGATMVPMPAFEDAKFDSIAASAAVTPPAAYFQRPDFDRLTPLTVRGDHVFGHLAPWNECHLGITNACVTAPVNDNGYSVFLASEVECDDGTIYPTGPITLAGGHAPRTLNAAAATRFYDDTESAVADVTIGEDQFGIWFSGALRPGISPSQRRSLMASRLSGDWRPFKGALELVGVLCVNAPGFALARSLVASGKQQALILTGMVPEREAQLESALDRVDAVVERFERLAMSQEAARIAESV